MLNRGRLAGAARLVLEALETRATPSFGLSSLAFFNGDQRSLSRGRADHGQQRQPLRHNAVGRRLERRHGLRAGQGSGTITTLASFNGTDGASPRAVLIMDSSGNLYGTTLEWRRLR